MIYAKLTNDGENYFRSHTHGHYEIMIVREGDGLIYSGDKKYPFYEGCIFIAPPGVEHSVYSDLGHKIINIGGNFDRLLLSSNEIYKITDNEFGEGRLLAEAIMRNIYINEAYARSLCESFIQFLLLHIDIQPNIYSVVHKITDEIEKNFNDTELDVTSILNASGYAEDYIRAKFLSVTKTTPIKYLTSVRMKNAKALMSLYDFSISEIAVHCGILDVAYFSRLFKKYYGISPKDYKLSLKDSEKN